MDHALEVVTLTMELNIDPGLVMELERALCLLDSRVTLAVTLAHAVR